METKTKVIIGISLAAVAAVAAYFMFKKPAVAGTNAGTTGSSGLDDLKATYAQKLPAAIAAAKINSYSADPTNNAAAITAINSQADKIALDPKAMSTSKAYADSYNAGNWQDGIIRVIHFKANPNGDTVKYASDPRNMYLASIYGMPTANNVA